MGDAFLRGHGPLSYMPEEQWAKGLDAPSETGRTTCSGSNLRLTLIGQSTPGFKCPECKAVGREQLACHDVSKGRDIFTTDVGVMTASETALSESVSGSSFVDDDCVLTAKAYWSLRGRLRPRRACCDCKIDSRIDG
jgi:hypothetical protein